MKEGMKHKLFHEFLGLNTTNGWISYDNWQEVMKVVEKIEHIASVTIINKNCKIETLDEEWIFGGETTLEAVFNACLESLKS